MTGGQIPIEKHYCSLTAVINVPHFSLLTEGGILGFFLVSH